MALTYPDATGKRLVLHVPDSTDGQDVSTSYSTQALGANLAKQQTNYAVITGIWVAGSAMITFQKQGTVVWSAQIDGSEQTGAGKATSSFEGTMAVVGSCAPSVAGCFVLQVQYDAKSDQLTVIGSAGPQVFDRKG